MGNETALVVIDTQLGMFETPGVPPVPDGERLLRNIEALLRRAREANVAVVHVRHAGGPGHPLEKGTGGWRIHPRVAPLGEEPIVGKETPDSFLDTTLAEELEAREVGHLVLAGMQTEYCVNTTCRRASGFGYDVTLAGDAHGTWDGDGLSADQIVAHHNAVLGGGFAEVVPTSQVSFGKVPGVTAPESVRFDENGLVPVVAQDAATGEVLTLAYANDEAVGKTLSTGEAHYYSRSRKELWRKGATSGNTQAVVEVRLDCDGDALLYRVEPHGPACHTGERTCFFTTLAGEGVGVAPRKADGADFGTTVERLAGTIAQRHQEMPEGSYTADLIRRGTDRLAQKVGEEAVEVVVASLRDDRVAEETADLVYHLLVLLEERGVGIDEVAGVLRDRHR